MRIVAGEFRGRTIAAPDGEGTRPTTDRVREALFSSLYSLRGGFDDAVVLDAFAGSGALGFEALSRGAAHAVFYERDPQAMAVCEGNARTLGLQPKSFTCVKRDVMQNPPEGQDPPFDLVFLDPPYATDPDDVVALVKRLDETGALAPETIVVYEHGHTSRREANSAAEAAGYDVVASRKYGKTGVTIWRTGEEKR